MLTNVSTINMEHGKFYVSPRHDASGTILIGYEVVSRSQLGGARVHHFAQAQHEDSLKTARAKCEGIADRLNARTGKHSFANTGWVTA